VLSGETVEATLQTDAETIVLGSLIGAGEVCGSIEEFPYGEGGRSYWIAVSATVVLRFTPDMALPAEGDWSYDGTELGTLTLWGTGLMLEPRNGATGDRELPDLEVSARVAVIDLPA
jgi:hypothetical protein